MHTDTHLLREFQQTLTPHERDVLRSYREFILLGFPSPLTEVDRQNINLSLQSFMTGYRFRVHEEKNNLG